MSGPYEWRSDCEPIRVFHRVTVTRIEAKLGQGTEDDPHRLVTIWLEDDGTLITRRDPWEESSQERGPDA